MALLTNIRDETAWKELLETNGIPPDDATAYAGKFVADQLTGAELPDITKADLKELGITVLAHQIRIIKIGKQKIRKCESLYCAPTNFHFNYFSFSRINF